MRENVTADDHVAKQSIAEEAAREEETLRARWEATQASLRVRFDEPISRATRLTQQTLGWFPVRVWRHFLQRNGFLLAAGVSYQALFAIFAAIYVAFAIAGIWLGGSPESVQAMIDLINGYIPGLIAPTGGIVTPDQVQEIAAQTAGVLGITGLIALGTVIWTAIGWVTFSRRAVRDIFGLVPDRRNYFVLKARDLVGAVVFGAALVAGAIASQAATWGLGLVFSMADWSTNSPLYNGIARVAAALVSFAINSTALAAMFKYLTGTSLRWRRAWPGALVGGAALTVLLLGAGLLLGYTPSNPLLATFAIFIGLLLWFRLNGIVILVAASWVAVATADRNVELIPQTAEDRARAEHEALLLAAHVRVRTAASARDSAPWYRRSSAERAIRAARRELAEVEASAPPPAGKPGSLFE
ncbi:YihY/virulence factor BrkB family protein [Microbacterium sp. NPDC076911]|uniref:YihY/virulence factor BrkB family protein n=1 Tax=Microbacterium sp. NPDC076911 TaxID=3154958 RepID=UPI003412B3BC